MTSYLSCVLCGKIPKDYKFLVHRSISLIAVHSDLKKTMDAHEIAWHHNSHEAWQERFDYEACLPITHVDMNYYRNKNNNIILCPNICFCNASQVY